MVRVLGTENYKKCAHASLVLIFTHGLETLHVTTEFFPVLMNRFGCKHRKQSSVPISPSYDRIIELVSSAAAAGSSSQ